MSCQTKLILVWDFKGEGEKNQYILEINGRKFIAGTCGLKIGSHKHKRINDLDGFVLCFFLLLYVCMLSLNRANTLMALLFVV